MGWCSLSSDDNELQVKVAMLSQVMRWIFRGFGAYIQQNLHPKKFVSKTSCMRQSRIWTSRFQDFNHCSRMLPYNGACICECSMIDPMTWSKKMPWFLFQTWNSGSKWTRHRFCSPKSNTFCIHLFQLRLSFLLFSHGSLTGAQLLRPSTEEGWPSGRSWCWATAPQVRLRWVTAKESLKRWGIY